MRTKSEETMWMWMWLRQPSTPGRPSSSLSSATSLTVPSAHPYHDAVPNGSTCSLHVPRLSAVVTNSCLTVRGGGGGGRRSSSPDDDSAVLVDSRSDADDENDATRNTQLNCRSYSSRVSHKSK